MKKLYQTNVCIGGPFDGRRYVASHDYPSFRAPLLKPLQLAPYPTADDPDAVSHTVEYLTYERLVFHTGTGNVSVWAAETEDAYRVLIRLIKGYEKCHDIAERAEGLLRDSESDTLLAGDFGKPGLMAQIDRLRAGIRRFCIDLIEQDPHR